MPGIGVDEFVFGVSRHRIMNAAFSRAHPPGGRFNGSNRGNRHAGFTLETSQAEVAWRKSVEFAEVNRFKESITYDDRLAGFGGEFHDIRDKPTHRNCLNPESYADSQLPAEPLQAEGSPGIICASVRHDGGVCSACFRAALVGNVRTSTRCRITLADTPEPEVELEETCMRWFHGASATGGGGLAPSFREP